MKSFESININVGDLIKAKTTVEKKDTKITDSFMRHHFSHLSGDKQVFLNTVLPNKQILLIIVKVHLDY